MLYIFYIFIALLIIAFIVYIKNTRKGLNSHIDSGKNTSEKTVAYPLNHLGLTKSSDFDKLWD